MDPRTAPRDGPHTGRTEQAQAACSRQAPGRGLTVVKAAAIRHTVLIADANPLTRRVVRDALQEGTRFVVAAEAATIVEAVELAAHYTPDVVLIEPGLDGMESVGQIRRQAPGTHVVVFCAQADDEREMDALRAGAMGFVRKDDGVAAAIAAMEAVTRGEASVSPQLTARMIELLRATPAAGTGLRPVRSALTTREWEVLDLMSSGASTSSMADQLVLTEETIYTHVKNIMRKLGVRTRQQAVAAAHGLMSAEA